MVFLSLLSIIEMKTTKLFKHQLKHQNDFFVLTNENILFFFNSWDVKMTPFIKIFKTRGGVLGSNGAKK